MSNQSMPVFGSYGSHVMEELTHRDGVLIFYALLVNSLCQYSVVMAVNSSQNEQFYVLLMSYSPQQSKISFFFLPLFPVQADAKGPAYEQAWMRDHSTFPASSGAILLYSSLFDTPQPDSNTAQEQANHFKLAFTSKFPDANSFKDFNGAHVSDLVTILLNGCPVAKVPLTVFSIPENAFNC
jgi:hypothetical protein